MTTTHEAIMPTPPPSDPSMITMIGGWVAAVVGLLATLAKLAYDRAVARDKAEEERKRDELEHVQGLQLEGMSALQRERVDLVGELRRQLAMHEERIQRLEAGREADAELLAQERAARARSEVVIETQAKEIARLRASRDHYRALALEGAEAARQAGSVHAPTLDDEISEADEASSKAGAP